MADKKETIKKATSAPKKSSAKVVAKEKPATKGGKVESAVIFTGGKQYIVSSGDRLKIEKIKGDYKEGEKVKFDKVLLTVNGGKATLGNPFISGASVSATISKIGKAKKVTVIKYKQKSRYFKKRGHRQPFFEVVID